MSSKRFSRRIPFGQGQWCTIRKALVSDCDAIRGLYDDIYGAAYPLPLIRDPKNTRAVLRDKEHLWLVQEHDGRLIGSVLFAWESAGGIGKVSAAVVRPDYRGHDLTQHAIAAGLEQLVGEGKPIELFYATTRTVTPAPARLVSRLGFVPCGVFPNVHKVATPETHGLNIFFRPEAILKRQLGPRLIPECVEFFEIAKDTLRLPDSAEVDDVQLPPTSDETFEFVVDQNAAHVQELYRSRLEERSLRWSFFPFHEPHVLCHTADHTQEAFIHFNRADGYGVIVGLKSAAADFAGFLDQLCRALHSLGLAYIELLVSAFDPLKQRQAFAARFLPCAYFPAMKITTGGKRMDYLVFSRSFQNLDFTGITLEGTPRRYLQAFMKCWYALLVSQAPDFEKSDQLFR